MDFTGKFDIFRVTEMPHFSFELNLVDDNYFHNSIIKSKLRKSILNPK